MDGYEIHAGPWLAATAIEKVARAGDPGRKIRQDALVALPECAHRVAVTVVPFCPARGKTPDLVAARAAVPRFGDQLDGRQHRVLPARIQEAAALVEAVGLARKDGAEVETEPVDVHLLHPIAQGVGDHLEDALVRQVESIPSAGVVDVIAPLVRQQPIVGTIVDTFEGQRRPELISLCRVVVNHVQDHFDAGIVKPRHHFLEFRKGEIGNAGVATRRGKKRNRIVAPVIGEPLVDQMLVGDEGVHRQQFDGRHPKAADVIEHLG